MLLRHPTTATLAGLDDTGAVPRQAIVTHIRECDRCRDRLMTIRRFRVAAAEATELDLPAGGLERILARHASGEPVLLPTDDPPAATVPVRRRPVAATLVAAALIVSLGWALPAFVRRVREPALPPPIAAPAAGVAIVPTQSPVNVRIRDAGPDLVLTVEMSAGPELRLTGEDAAAEAVFGIVADGLSAAGVRAGRLAIAIPPAPVTTRIFLEDQLVATANGTGIRVPGSPEPHQRLVLRPGGRNR
ncbi:MAG: hypothetical protein AB7L66_13855 [Gemmatimonadales bacterium]